ATPRPSRAVGILAFVAQTSVVVAAARVFIESSAPVTARATNNLSLVLTIRRAILHLPVRAPLRANARKKAGQTETAQPVSHSASPNVLASRSQPRWASLRLSGAHTTGAPRHCQELSANSTRTQRVSASEGGYMRATLSIRGCVKFMTDCGLV